MTPSIRTATLDDRQTIDGIIAESSRGLSQQDYTAEQIEAALGTAWGTDTQLIRDGTYFVVEADGEIVACGGWSRRKTLFGSDARADREPDTLDPARDAAKVRAFFVRPRWARRGIGRALLERCEAEASEAGFRSTELMATRVPIANLTRSTRRGMPRRCGHSSSGRDGRDEVSAARCSSGAKPRPARPGSARRN